MKHAVFATHVEAHYRSRVTRWLDFGAAHDEWERLNDRRVAGELPLIKFFEVRSQDDPNYNQAPYRPWDSLPVEERQQYVTLSRGERQRMVEIARRAGDRDSGADAVLTELMNHDDGRWEHLPVITISDYAWGVANFAFPRERW